MKDVIIVVGILLLFWLIFYICYWLGVDLLRATGLV